MFDVVVDVDVTGGGVVGVGVVGDGFTDVGCLSLAVVGWPLRVGWLCCCCC